MTSAGPATVTMTLDRLLDDAPLHWVNVYEEDGLATIVTIVPGGTYSVWDEPPATVPDVDPNENETEPPSLAWIVSPGYRTAISEIGPTMKIVGLACVPE